LSGNKICRKGAKKIANLLKVNSTLQVLNLYNNNIGDKGATEIGNALKKNVSLKSLK